MIDVQDSKVGADLIFDKSNWKVVRFDEVAFQKKGFVDRNDIAITKYIKGEHMGSEDLHIREWGELTDEYLGPAFIRKFEKGDVLYGSRRTYLRKVAVADFDGITSNTTFVINAKPKVLNPDLLPFIMLSEGFAQNSIKNSKGSVNPYINWKDIGEYEFILPPIEQQAELAELLWAGDIMIESDLNLYESLKNLLAIYTSNLIWKANLNNAELKFFADKTLGKFIDGDWIESKDQSEEGIRLLQLADIGVNEFINKSSRFISDDTFKRLKCFEVLPGDIIIARMPDPIGRACRITDIGKRMITAVDCCIVRVDENINNSDYLLHLLNSKEFLAKATSLASGSTRQRVSKKVLESVLVPIPNRQVQITIAAKLNSILHNITSVATKLKKGQALQKALINEIFG